MDVSKFAQNSGPNLEASDPFGNTPPESAGGRVAGSPEVAQAKRNAESVPLPEKIPTPSRPRATRPSPESTMSFTLSTYTRFLETLPHAALIVDRRGAVLRSNGRARRFFQRSAEELDGGPVAAVLPEMTPGAWKELSSASAALFRGSSDLLKLSIGRRGAANQPVEIAVSRVDLERSASFLLVIRDIAEFSELQSVLQDALERERRIARLDPLTEAANRRFFYERLESEIQKSLRERSLFSIVFVDIDNFKAANDAFGHERGDEILRGVVRCAQSHIHAHDLVARLGGDEFAFILTKTDLAKARRAVSLVQKELNQTARHHGWRVTFSFGALMCVGVRHTADHLVKMADALMYEVKRGGKNAVKWQCVSEGACVAL